MEEVWETVARLYDTDTSKPKKKKPRQPKLPKEQGLGGGLDNQAPLNDYRNRMPFHKEVKDGVDYYYWQYGAIFELELEIEDPELPLIPQHVVDVLTLDDSIVDRETKIANVLLGTMATKGIDSYLRAEKVEKLLTKTITIVNNARQLTAKANQLMDAIERALKGGGDVSDVVIESIQAQIGELRLAVSNLERYADDIEGIRAELQEIRKDTETQVSNLRTEYQNRLKEIVASYQLRLEEVETRCQNGISNNTVAHKRDIEEVRGLISDVRRDGVGANVGVTLPEGEDAPLIAIVDKKLYVKVSGRYVEAGSASVVPIVPEKDVEVQVDEFGAMTITNIDEIEATDGIGSILPENSYQYDEITGNLTIRSKVNG